MGAALALAAAVAGGWVVLGGGPTDDRILVVDEAGAISLLDPASGQVVYEVDDAVPTPDRSALLTTRWEEGSTVLESRDPTTGGVTGETTLSGFVSVRTISPEGGAVALLPGERGTDLYEPEPRATTSITVAYIDERDSRTYELDGNFEPEMFSLDESTLFLIEFEPATSPTGYLVRQLDLETGEVGDTGAPQVGLNERMKGRARAQVLHPDGTFLYTLYTLPTEAGPVLDVEAPDDQERWAFIHVINLDEEWSHCIFLPVPIGTVEEASVGMGISPDGRDVYVADASTSTVARIDARELTVEATVHVDELVGRSAFGAVEGATGREAGTKPAVAVASDGVVFVGDGNVVLGLAADSLKAVSAWGQQGAVTSLSVSASGTDLRVAGPQGISIIDRATGEETAVLRPPGGETVGLLGPPQGSVTQFSIECAC